MSMWDDHRGEYDGYEEPDLDPDYERSWWNKKGIRVEYRDMDKGYLARVRDFIKKKHKQLPMMLMVELRIRGMEF